MTLPDWMHDMECKLDNMRAELADERIDAERVAWLRTLLCDYERLYRMHEDEDPDPEATALMLREMWGMHRGLLKIHGQYPPIETANEIDEDTPL